LPFKANADRRHRIPKQRYRVTNWAEYDAALRQRGSLMVWFSEEAVAAWQAEPRTTRGGQPWYSALAITTALTLRAVFRLALRQTEGLIGSILQLLGLDLPVPDHSTLSRRAEALEVPQPRSSSGSGPAHLLVDSTGLRLCGLGKWLVEQHGTRARRSWRKLHIGVDTDTGRIVASALTTNDVDDGSQVGPLLDQTDGPVASFTADGAFDRDDVYAEVAARHQLVARVDGVGAWSPTRVPGHAMRTYSGRPRSSMRFSAPAAIATSVARRPSVCERSPSPITRFQRPISASTKARRL
jgi:Transposase DDE domain